MCSSVKKRGRGFASFKIRIISVNLYALWRSQRNHHSQCGDAAFEFLDLLDKFLRKQLESLNDCRVHGHLFERSLEGTVFEKTSHNFGSTLAVGFQEYRVVHSSHLRRSDSLHRPNVSLSYHIARYRPTKPGGATIA